MRVTIYLITSLLLIIAVPDGITRSQSLMQQIEHEQADLLRWQTLDRAGEFGLGIYARAFDHQRAYDHMAWWGWNLDADGRTPRNASEGRLGLFMESRYLLPGQGAENMEFYLLYAPIDGQSYRPFAANMWINEPYAIASINASEIWVDSLDYGAFARFYPADGYGVFYGAVGQWGQTPPAERPKLNAEPTTAELADVLAVYGLIEVHE